MYRSGGASTTVTISVGFGVCRTGRSRTELIILGASAARLDGSIADANGKPACRSLKEAIETADMPRKKAFLARMVDVG